MKPENAKELLVTSDLSACSLMEAIFLLGPSKSYALKVGSLDNQIVASLLAYQLSQFLFIYVCTEEAYTKWEWSLHASSGDCVWSGMV